MDKILLKNFISKAVKDSILENRKPKTLQESVKSGDVVGLVKWFENPINWQADADAVAMGRGREDDLVNFVKAHREFDEWSWGQVKDALDQADEMNLMENFKKELFKKSIKEQILAMFEHGMNDVTVPDNHPVAQEKNIELLKNKIAASKDPQLMQTFQTIAQKYRSALTTPKNMEVISKAIDLASQQNRWKDLENWFMDQVIKNNRKQSSLEEFVLVNKK